MSLTRKELDVLRLAANNYGGFLRAWPPLVKTCEALVSEGFMRRTETGPLPLPLGMMEQAGYYLTILGMFEAFENKS